MKRVAIALGVLLASLAMPTGPVGAEPSADAPVTFEYLGDGFGHSHKVNTGNGGCVSIDAVFFKVGDRGLHRGANMSGPDKGPWHVAPEFGFPGCP